MFFDLEMLTIYAAAVTSGIMFLYIAWQEPTV